MKVARNDPCPCGSGLKHKRCCGRVRSEPGIPVRKIGDRELPEIHVVDDLRTFYEAFLRSLSIFDLPRPQALLHCLRAAQSAHSLYDALLIEDHDADSHWSNLRLIQDMLRVLVYEIFSRCPLGTDCPNTTRRQLHLGTETCDLVSRLAMLRDSIDAVKHSFISADIDRATKVITFYAGPDAVLDSLREGRTLERRRSITEALQMQLDQVTIQQAHADLMDTVALGHQNYSFSCTPSRSLIETFIEAIECQSSPPGSPGGLPGHWSTGNYSIADFHTFWHRLQALVSWHELVFLTVSRHSRGKFVPHNSSIVLMRARDIISYQRRFSTLSTPTLEAIIRDLTYDPVAVPWTDTQYQPLIPIGEDYLGLVPVVIGASSFERNLLVIINKLPWRRGVANALKDGREDVMIERIVPVARSLGLNYKFRLRLGSKAKPMGDIDLLLWDQSSVAALAVSLKWFYGPDSVHEVTLHSELHRKAIGQHHKVVSFLKTHAAEVAARFSLEPRLTEGTRVYPVFVTNVEEVLERDRDGVIPCCVLDDFLAVLVETKGSLPDTYEELCRLDREPSQVLTEEVHRELALGSYTFRPCGHAILSSTSS